MRLRSVDTHSTQKQGAISEVDRSGRAAQEHGETDHGKDVDEDNGVSAPVIAHA